MAQCAPAAPGCHSLPMGENEPTAGFLMRSSLPASMCRTSRSTLTSCPTCGWVQDQEEVVRQIRPCFVLHELKRFSMTELDRGCMDIPLSVIFVGIGVSQARDWLLLPAASACPATAFTCSTAGLYSVYADKTCGPGLQVSQGARKGYSPDLEAERRGRPSQTVT